MLRKNVVKGALGLSAAAALCAVFAVQAQSTGGTGQSGGQTTSGQQSGSTGTGGTGGTGNSSTSATGQSGMSGSSQAGTSTTSAAGQATGSGTATSGMLAKSDQKMIMSMAQANMAEIEAGRLAQSKSQNDDVKKFAQQMIDDHTKALDDVKQLAQAKGVALPADLDRSHKAMASKLQALSGDKFDRAYLAQAGVADHKKNHAMLQKAHTSARDPDLKALIARIQPVVDQHLTDVQQLHKNTARGSSKTQGSTGSSSDKRDHQEHDNKGAMPDKK
jgi:putative membrane protein